MQKFKLLLTVLCLSTLTACTFAYKQDVQQGNIIDSSQICALHVGMTKDQVRYLLGSPVLSHVLNQERWDYISTCKIGHGPPKILTRFSLYFSGDRLVRINIC